MLSRGRAVSKEGKDWERNLNAAWWLDCPSISLHRLSTCPNSASWYTGGSSPDAPQSPTPLRWIITNKTGAALPARFDFQLSRSVNLLGLVSEWATATFIAFAPFPTNRPRALGLWPSIGVQRRGKKSARNVLSSIKILRMIL